MANANSRLVKAAKRTRISSPQAAIKNPSSVSAARKASAKVIAPVTALVPVKIKKVDPIPPVGGFRTATVRDHLILAAIVKTPSLTAREYGELMQPTPMYTTSVNDCILRTREGRAYAEGGMVAIPCVGRHPSWYGLLHDRSRVPLRKRENQFPVLRLNKVVIGENRCSLAEMQALARALTMTVSPIQKKQIYIALNREMAAVGMKRAAEQKDIADIKRLVDD